MNDNQHEAVLDVIRETASLEAEIERLRNTLSLAAGAMRSVYRLQGQLYADETAIQESVDACRKALRPEIELDTDSAKV